MPEPQIHIGTQLVLVDVVVQDASGHPVRNLPSSAFHVTEKAAPEVLAAFEEHSTSNPSKAGPVLPAMPPGTFTNYTPVPEGSTLNILLVDALNTPLKDQAFLRDQLKRFVNKLPPGTRLAILGLNTQLRMLQGFTSDAQLLKDAVNHKLIPRASSLMDNPTTGTNGPSLSEAAADMDRGLVEVSSALANFEASEQAVQNQFRVDHTLDAFNTLAHYLSGFQGRKNLVWFSGTFPGIFPTPNAGEVTLLQNDVRFQETSKLLAQAHVAVFPVDARGLTAAVLFQPGVPEAPVPRTPADSTRTAIKTDMEDFDQHSLMAQLAEDTGGHAYYNTNDLVEATTRAIDFGSNYYTLAYTPANHSQRGEFRAIHVDVSGPQVPAGLKLVYRPGYYAEDSRSPRNQSRDSALDFTAPGNGAGPTDRPASAAQTYRRAAMAHGAPNPQDVLFKVRVLPTQNPTESNLIADETANPDGTFKPPFRRYNIDFATPWSDIHLLPQPDGNFTGAVEFNAFVYNREGKLLNRNSKTIELNLKPVVYQRLRSTGMNMHMQVSTPGSDESYLRLAVHDVDANRYGAVEISTDSVRALTPPTPAPASKTPSPAPASPQ